MIIFKLGLVIVVPLILGLMILSLLIKKQAHSLFFWEKLALAFVIGLGCQTIIMFFLAWLKIPLSLSNILVTIFPISILSISWQIKNNSFCFKWQEIKQSFNIFSLKLAKFEWILLSLISLKVIYVFFAALVKPLVDVDAWQQYSIIAKMIYIDKTFFLPYAGQFMGDKPLFPFISQGWVLIGIQSANESMLKIISPLLFVCFLVIIFSVLKRHYANKYALLFTFLASSLPFTVYHTTTAYADFPMSCYYALATIYLYLFMKEFMSYNKNKSFVNLVLAAILMGLAVWVKRAGIVLAGVNLVILTVFLISIKQKISTIDLKKLIISFMVFALITLPWIIYQPPTFITRLFTTSQQTLATAQAPFSQINGKFGIIAQIFTKKLFFYGDWHLLWALMLVSLTLFYKKTFARPLIFLLFIILIDILALVVQFSSGETFRWLLDGTLLDRLLMNTAFVVLYFSAEAILPKIDTRVAEVVSTSALNNYE